MGKEQIHQIIWKHIVQRFPQRKERLQLIVLLVSLGMLILGLPLHFLGWVGVNDILMELLSAIELCISFGYIIAIFIHNTKPGKLITTFGIFIQIVQSMRIVYLATLQPIGFEQAIIINQVIAFTVVIFQIIAATRYAPIITTVINLCALFYVGIYATPYFLNQLVIVFTFEEISICVLGLMLQRFIFNIQRDNKDYMHTLNGILKAFNMTQQELVAFLRICRTSKSDHSQLSRYFNMLDERTEENLIRCVESRKTERAVAQEQLKIQYPQLTPTELDVCRLIIAGKSTNEIALILEKNANNISSVRTHIRKKLKLTQDEDLRTVLLGKL